MEISCVNCGSPYPSIGLPFCCTQCGQLYDFHSPLIFDQAQVDGSQPGIWRYRHTFGAFTVNEPVSLGEGGTPLLWANTFGHMVAFKCEFLNPSGSFKDRGSAIVTALLKTRGISKAVEDSSGNAGASFAAYAARAGIKARIFVPESTSGPKRRQIEAYGAELISISGSRSDAAEAAMSATKGGAIYASHAYLPFNLAGYATAAYEIYDQLGSIMPGAVILPVGQGGLLLGLVRGFEALRIANNIKVNTPKIIGVQTRACAPIWELFTEGKVRTDISDMKRILAEGIQVCHPMRGDMVIQLVMESHGSICVVDEVKIIPGRNALARMGFFVEPTSAIVWSALQQTLQDLPDPIIVILTGSGYKYEKKI